MLLVTGASGLLGANLLVSAGKRDLVAVYNSHPVTSDHFRSVRADLTKREEVRAVIREFKPEWIVHLAAYTNLDYCELNPKESEAIHVEMTRMIAELGSDVNAGILYMCTDSVFDGTRGDYKEDDLPNPLNCYAQSKLQGERIIQDTCKKYLILRGNFFGWNCQNKKSLAEWIIGELEAGRGLIGFTDIIFNPLLVNTIAELILEFTEKDLTGLYHLGCREYISKYEFARLIAECFHLKAALITPASIDKIPFKAKRPKNTSLATKKIERIANVKLSGIKDSIARFKELRDSGYVKRLKNLCRCE